MNEIKILFRATFPIIKKKYKIYTKHGFGTKEILDYVVQIDLIFKFFGKILVLQ